MNNTIKMAIAKGIENILKTNDNQDAPKIIKSVREVRHEIEDDIVVALEKIDGVECINTWSTEGGIVNFKFMFHDAQIVGQNLDGKIVLDLVKYEGKKKIEEPVGYFYRSVNCGLVITVNSFNKKWSQWLLNKFSRNLMGDFIGKSMVTAPPEIKIGSTVYKTDKNVVYVDGTPFMSYNHAGRLTWFDDYKWAPHVDFIKRNYVK